ncbi:DUF1378 family protein, partial [Escherichia coli]|nr:DUF1378 family protein [Escherichia coli]EFA1080067.1 DUF1378 family protein [Escherichia coli]EIB9760403.1 DUF1378 family protein [Escherichia coli]
MTFIHQLMLYFCTVV